MIYQLPYTPRPGATAALVPVEIPGWMQEMWLHDNEDGTVSLHARGMRHSGIVGEIEPPLAPGDTVGWEVPGGFTALGSIVTGYTVTRTATAVRPVRLGPVFRQQTPNVFGTTGPQSAFDVIETLSRWFPDIDAEPGSWWWLIEFEK